MIKRDLFGLALLIYSTCSIGFAYIVGHSLITRAVRGFLFGQTTPEERIAANHGEEIPIDSPRRWIVALLECPACLGFYEGLITGWFIQDFVPFLPAWGTMGLLALFTCGTNLIFGKLLGLMD